MSTRRVETSCPREVDMLSAVTSGRWPDRCDAELREHAAASAFVRNQTLPLVLLVSACVLLAPVAVYLMLSED